MGGGDKVIKLKNKKRGRKPKCIFCGSYRTNSKGSRVTSTLGRRPLRTCKDCHRKFTVGRAVPDWERKAKPQPQPAAAPVPSAA